jgi:hypothetical protein
MEPSPAPRDSNRAIGWVSLAAGAATGLILGLWSFDGPVDVPAWLGGYSETSRRLARLGHIAWFGLGILNLLLARELPRSALGAGGRRAASVLMNFGNIGLPLVLFAAAAWRPCKYLLPIPALSVFFALALAARGALGPRGALRPVTDDGDEPSNPA